MEFKNYTYLIILLITMAAPLVLSFDKKMQFYKNLKYILPAIIITGAVFLMWDISFTRLRIWGYNPEYLIGKDLVGLPVEQWFFFLAVPYSAIFVYEALKFYLRKYEYANPFLAFSLLLIVGFALMSYFFRYQGYTFITFLFSGVYLTYTVFRNKFKQHLTKFYLAYFVLLVPFLIVNGILTSLPVVEYNNTYTLNIRLIHIPIENFSYFFLLLLMATTVYEFLKESKYY